MVKKSIIGFEVSEDKKKEIIEAANNYKSNNINMPLKVSQFIRVAIDKLLKEKNL